jgi:hypothetical protein
MSSRVEQEPVLSHAPGLPPFAQLLKSKDVEDEKDAMKELRTKQDVEATGPTTIGDLIRAQMENQG